MAKKILTLADSKADIAGKCRPDNHSKDCVACKPARAWMVEIHTGSGWAPYSIHPTRAGARDLRGLCSGLVPSCKFRVAPYTRVSA